ncbi:hypothetical protein [Mastigocoleus testarum]|uniref:Uncharacterized protein n=1 Tax=Mastigocoleus testarum BC008 TaxID=371196 RepID=A0A0V7ZJW0_9CYAN|nr:hypothetical protein [Mastigocoleus testarum]KST64082.1 hypothetical protein BC008_40525 [Mastigocoleus testarum BC008]KST64792.1 hypothetical protein BC008_41500 [Mastigocoleus testarum BC008]
MAIKILASKLVSRTIRKKAADNGIRKFSFTGNDDTKDKDGNVLTRFFSSFLKFTSNVLGEAFRIIASGLKFSFTALWSGVVNAFQFLWNFDWNISDEQINNNVIAQYQSMVNNLGSVTGQSMGWLVCGVLPSSLIFVFNEPLGAHLLSRVGLEAFEELSGSIAGLATSTFQSYMTAAFLSIYRDARALIRGTELDYVNNQLDKGLKLVDLRTQLEIRRRPFIFAEKFKKGVDSIENKFVKGFIENFVEEFSETCIEAGYVVAGGLDAFYAQQHQAKDVLLGKEQTIELEFKDDGKIEAKHIV